MKVNYLTIALAGALFFLAGWLLVRELPLEPKYSVSTEALAPEASQFTQRKRELTAEIAHLRQLLVVADQYSKASNPPPYPATNGEPLTKFVIQPKPSTHNAADTNTVIVDLPDIFSSESRNNDWAFAREQKLQDSLAVDHYFQGQELSTIECKSSSCRVQFYTTDMEQKMEIASRLNRLFMTQQSIAFDPQIMIGKSNNEQLTDFYFREANSK